MNFAALRSRVNIFVQFLKITVFLLTARTLDASPNDLHQQVYKQCLAFDHFKEDDDALNRAYKELIRKLCPSEAAELKKEQNNWISALGRNIRNENSKPQKLLMLETASRKQKLEEMLKTLN